MLPYLAPMVPQELRGVQEVPGLRGRDPGRDPAGFEASPDPIPIPRDWPNPDPVGTLLILNSIDTTFSLLCLECRPDFNQWNISKNDQIFSLVFRVSRRLIWSPV